jgi:hypothetical protein
MAGSAKTSFAFFYQADSNEEQQRADAEGNPEQKILIICDVVMRMAFVDRDDLTGSRGRLGWLGLTQISIVCDSADKHGDSSGDEKTAECFLDSWVSRGHRESGCLYAERYQPAMRLAGATRADARGVNDSRIGSDGWLGRLFIARISTIDVAS